MVCIVTTEEHDIPQSMRDEFNQMIDGIHVAGGFYELYAQRLCDVVAEWIDDQPDDRRAQARTLAQGHPDYLPDRTGRWHHNAEDNDVFFVENERPPEPQPRLTPARRSPS
jgi:hypothetical protein